jgi:hypothetical protein
MPITTRPVRATTGHRWGRHARVRTGLAAERSGGYRAGPGGADDGGPVPFEGGAEGAPFGLPVLAELPRLASLLHHLDAADRAQLAAVAELADLLRGDEVERTTGVGVDHWLAAVGRLTRMDRRLLVRTCRLLHRLPTLDAAVRAGRLSFAQLRGVSLALRRSRQELDEQVDRVLAATFDALDGLERPDPDVLARQIGDAVDELDPGDLAERERDAVSDRFLALQPRLDGTGGRFSGDLDAAGLALLDAATQPTVQQATDAGGVGAARADLLLHRLAASSDGPSGPTGPDVATAPDRGPQDGDVSALGDGTGGSVPDPPVLDRSGSSWWTVLAPPKLVMRLRFDTLLDPSVPAELLTALVGGRLKLTGPAARRLLDERGASLRTVVVDDDGTVLGVGRATRRPPGWLSEANLAVHDTCTGPGCDRPATIAHTDHATPWWPTRPDQPAGTTDVDNVGPLCDATNRAKEASGWQVDQRRPGIRTWRHDRSGLTCTTIPSTWRPEGDPRRGGGGHHRGRRDERARGQPNAPPCDDDLPF